MVKKEIGLYIHIPFCKHKCTYCDFISFDQKDEYIEKYVEAVIKEIQEAELENKYDIRTVYIGGGTPSILDSSLIGSILKTINANKETEVTIEVNPGTVSQDKLKSYKEFGVNRLSIGLQSTNNRLLKQIGRIHDYEEFLKTYKMARDFEFNNINVDLMLGLPNQDLKSLKKSLKDVISLKPEHISLYSLILEENTQLYNEVENGIFKMIDEGLERVMYWESKKELESSGYIHYEISNFAKQGFFSKHNVDCWEQKEYIGIGLSAHSYINGVRYSNIANIQDYIDNINSNNFGKNRRVHEKQTIETKKKEWMLLRS